MMYCSRCKQEKPQDKLIVHARRYSKRIEDFTISWYCLPCQAQRVTAYNRSRPPKPPKLYDTIIDADWVRAAKASNNRLMAKYS